MSLTEAIIMKNNAVSLEVLRQPKTTRNDKRIPFTTSYNSNNRSFGNFQYSKTMSKHLILTAYFLGLNSNQNKNITRKKSRKELRQLHLSFKGILISI